MRWAEISVDVECGSAEAVTNILMEEGCGGTVTEYPSARPFENSVSVKGYLPVDDTLEKRLESIRRRVASLPDLGLQVGSDGIVVKWVEDDDWATAWRKYFKPIRLGQIVVKPSWEDWQAQPEDVIVEIDPGMAFGTGNHPTTALCLLILQDLIKGGEIVLDVGTGSGILAIAAAKLGASVVVGIDVDPVAVEVARRNIESAGVNVEVMLSDTPLAFPDRADIVVANIVPNVIIEMAEALSEKVRPGGKLVTSGIVVERLDEVRSKLESIGLRTLEWRVDGDWVALISEKS